jgi:hypothetical protein
MENKCGWWNRKFHIEKEMPDGNIYRGFINVNADTKDELYKREEIKGDFWVKRRKDGWHGQFFLDGNKKSDLREKPLVDVGNYVITNGVFIKTIPFSGIKSRADAERILRSTEPVKYEETPLLCGRLEDCIFAEETHFWRYTK